jgi:hypothetical protein
MRLLTARQDVDAEEVHGKDRVHDLKALLVHECAEAFMRINEALRLLFCNIVELRRKRIHESSSFSTKLARAWGDRSLEARAAARRALASAWSMN